MRDYQNRQHTSLTDVAADIESMFRDGDAFTRDSVRTIIYVALAMGAVVGLVAGSVCTGLAMWWFRG